MRIFTRAVMAAMLLSSLGTAVAQDANTVELELAPQPLSNSLREVAQEFDLKIAFYSDSTEGLEAPALAGDFTSTEALDTLLADTSLEYTYVNDSSVAVRPKSAADGDLEPGKSQPASSQLLMAQNQTSVQQNQSRTSSQNESDEEATILEEIVVVGTSIRGVQSASPIIIYDRQAIIETGAVSVQDFMRTVPQNFGGGITDTSVSNILADQDGGSNLSETASVNLRGLGSEATLVLMNGRRLSTGLLSGVVDVSMIPLGAVDRIEVLTDGASAIYGADAIAGVVNIVLRDDFDGAETKLAYGSVSDGNHDESTFGQSFGKQWNSGDALFSYSYLKRTNLDSSDRSYTAGAPPNSDLLPENEQHGVLFSIHQDVTDSTELFGTFLYSTRDTESTFNNGLRIEFRAFEIKQTDAAVGANIDLNENWEARTSVQYSNSETDRDIFFDDVVQIPTGKGLSTDTDVWSFDTVVDGKLFNAPGGDARLALGQQYRTESVFGAALALTDFVADRSVTAFFSELFVPLVGEGNRRSGVDRFELSAAIRYEDYSDVGTTTNPKFGVLWSPVKGLNLRGTWGTSFRAPVLESLDVTTFITQSFIFALPDPTSATGTTPTLVKLGNNPNLRPEESTMWTAGVDFQPETLPGFSASISYFDIDYTDRIGSPVPDSDLFNVLNLEALYAPVITRDPDMALIDFWANSPGFVGNFSGAGLDEVGAFVDNGLANISARSQKGIDFALSHEFERDRGTFNVEINGTYLIEREIRLTPTSPSGDNLNRAYNPTDLKLRGSFSWKHNGVGITSFINYVPSYQDIRPASEGTIDSWTTVDLNFSYDMGSRDAVLLNDMALSLNVRNLLDEDPPFVAEPNFGLNFDPTNASAVGRFISLSLTKKW